MNNKSDLLNELAAALAKAQGEIEGARKDSKNPFFKSSYAGLDSVVEASRPTMVKYGLSIVQTMGHGPLGPTLITTLLHASGQWVSGEQPIFPKGGESATPQDLGSAISYARRYGYAAMVGVIQVDDDGESAMGRGGAPSAGKTNGSAASTVAAKTAAKQQALKERHGPSPKEKASAPTSSQQEPRQAAPGATAEVRAIPEEGEFWKEEAPKLRGAAGGSHEEMARSEDGIHPSAARKGNGGAPLPGAVPSRNGPSQNRASGLDEKGNGADPASANGASLLISRASGAAENRGPHSGAPSPQADLPSGPGAGGGPVVGSGAEGNAGIPSGGASSSTPKGSTGKAGKPQGGSPVVGGKPVPRTEEEIQWFVSHLQEELMEVKSMAQLAELWNFNAVAVKSLPGPLKANVIAWKNDAKERLR